MSVQTETHAETGNLLLDRLPAEACAALGPHMERVSLSHGQPLIIPDEPIRHVYFPLNALASLVTLMEDGSTVESGAVGREGMVGVPALLCEATTPMQTLVQIPGDALKVRAQVIKDEFDRGGALQKLLYGYLHTLFVVASQTAACNRLHNVDARLCRWLLMSSDGVASDELALTQEFLATMLGTRRPGVTEAACRLQSAGLIAYRRGHIRILDRAGLERAACECYRRTRDEFDRLPA